MKVIATDLDRTLIPNGKNRLSNGAMELFKKLLKKNKVSLVYVTGRNKRLILDAMKRYNLPKPLYCISLVGVAIYKYSNGKLVEDLEWQSKLERSCFSCTASNIRLALSSLKLKSQSSAYLHKFKQSYYVNIGDKHILKKVKALLKRFKINAAVVYSIDTKRNVGLIDILPPNATKIKALSYVIKKLGLKNSDMVFCGDSGNDLSALTSGIKAILVKNAHESVKQELLKFGNPKKFYIAQGNFFVNGTKLNGNYVSGIIEGAYHFGLFK
ncbi:HAD-IIB family hydrolase [Candidatus Woesearchaeota archaeon]|nr:MAG: HAD-IIB family hydrolase [Candidatus Woesearchaeota archaeon]